MFTLMGILSFISLVLIIGAVFGKVDIAKEFKLLGYNFDFCMNEEQPLYINIEK